MRRDNYKERISLAVLLTILLIAEVVPMMYDAIYGSFSTDYLLNDRLIDFAGDAFGVFGLPLSIIILGVLYSDRWVAAVLLALLTLAAGLFGIYAVSVGGPDGGIMKLPSMLVYWISAVMTLILNARFRVLKE